MAHSTWTKRDAADGRNSQVLRVRPAESTDAARIVAILRAGFPPALLRYTIFGCDGIEQYVKDSIRHQRFGTSVWYVSCPDRSHAVGFAEIRRSRESLFVNHIYVTPSARGRGTGTGLMYHALNLARDCKQQRVELDVFSDNSAAKTWYESLGLAESHQQRWVETAWSDQTRHAGRQWHASGLGQADRIHATYGFSEFSLHVPSGMHRIGRLGRHLFR